MQDVDQAIADLGNEPPLVADGRSGPPDRREISARWLSGTFLTGLTSSVLMGVALFAALDGRELLAAPPVIFDLSNAAKPNGEGQAAKTARVMQPRQIVRAKDRRRIEVSTVSRVGDSDVIRTMPIMQVKMALAAGYKTSRSYPPYDPLRVMMDDSSDTSSAAQAASPQIYGTKAESDMVLKTVDFPVETASFDERNDLSADEVEEVVRNTAAILTDGDVQVAALHHLDPSRFGDSLATQTLIASYGVKITQENVSTAAREPTSSDEVVYAEDIIPFNKECRVDEALETAGYDRDEASTFAEKIADILNGSTLRAGSALRVGLEVWADKPKIVRVSVYDGSKHTLTVAMNDEMAIVQAKEPEPNPELLTAFDDSPPVAAGGNLPTVYDGVYRAAFSYGMSRESTRRLVRLLSSEVDLQKQVAPTDRLEVLFSQPDDENEMSDDSQLLYVAATFAGQTRRFYRFLMPDGTVDYFDKDGASARTAFLLRNPLPSGKFRSGFGGRQHPILGYARMHTGVDWAAPTGTPIIASGNGTIEKSGWASGYGKQTVIDHGNGYETSYNHQSAFARGIRPGVRVKQGQIIGYVGSTGLSTGAHLHYELIVNGTKVDPMRVRLPSGGRSLKGDDLTAFKSERQRIDDLLKEESDGSLKVAAGRTGT
jgi:murein DD-endopeptidase MepM/ murein hydrolase activator NlpD